MAVQPQCHQSWTLQPRHYGELLAPDVANAEEGASGAPSAAPTATTALAATEEEAKQTEKEEVVDEVDEVALMGDMGLELSESGEEIPLRRQRIFPMVQSLEAGSSHDVHETVTQSSCSTAVKETVLSGVPRATPTVPACSVCGRDDFQHNGAMKTHEHHCQKRANRKARLEEVAEAANAEEAKEEEEEEEEPEYIVDCILSERTSRSKQLQYEVRWGGDYYGEVTWEPAEFLERTTALAKWKRDGRKEWLVAHLSGTSVHGRNSNTSHAVAGKRKRSFKSGPRDAHENCLREVETIALSSDEDDTPLSTRRATGSSASATALGPGSAQPASRKRAISVESDGDEDDEGEQSIFQRSG